MPGVQCCLDRRMGSIRPYSARPRAIDENGGVDNDRARTLLAAERTRVEGLIAGLRVDRADNRDLEDEQDVDWADPAQPLTSEGTDDAVAAGLQDRLQAIERAEARLAAGTYGRSVRSGAPIPDERLEADPAAELTVEEASPAPGGL
jgi:DnaK suppressor protein